MFHSVEDVGLRFVRRLGQSKPAFSSQSGQAIIEYVLIVSLVSVALIVAVVALSGNISLLFDSIIAFFAART